MVRASLWVLVLAVACVLYAASVQAATFGCEIRAGSCLGNQTLLLRLNSSESGAAPNNSHAQLANASPAYPWSVCCWSDSFRTMNNSCTGNGYTVLRLSNASDAHVQANNRSDYAYPACLNLTAGTVACEYANDACSSGYGPVVSMASSESADLNLTNAHVADPGLYRRKVCCRVSGLTPPVVASANLSPINTTKGSDLTCANGSVSDADGDAVTLHYNWYVNGTSVTMLNFPLDYDDAAGVTHDISGYGRHGTVNGSRFLPTGGVIGGAFLFDGVDDSIFAAEDNDFGGKNLTVSAWIKIAGNGSDMCVVCRQKSITAKNFEAAIAPNRTPEFYIHQACSDVGGPLRASTVLDLDTWYFLTYRIEHGVNASIFINGEHAASTASLTSVASSCGAMQTRIGSWQRNDQWTFNGTIDEPMIFQRALTDSEIRTLYQSGNRILNRTELRKGENWNCSITPVDSTGLNGTAVRSNQSHVNGSIPGTVSLLYPAPGNQSVFERFVNFSWSAAQEVDGDAVSYTLNVTVTPGACAVQQAIDNISGVNRTFGELCVDQMYNWTVRACDVDGCGATSGTANFTIPSVLMLAFISNNTDFGMLTPGQSKTTDSYAVLPFIIRNDGNVYANITIAGNNSPFASVGLDDGAFQFRAADNETGSINLSGSQTSYVPVPSSPQAAAKQLNYSDATDTLAIHINITVPTQEPPGAKAANVTFRGVSDS